jgi:hypothetical protein
MRWLHSPALLGFELAFLPGCGSGDDFGGFGPGERWRIFATVINCLQGWRRLGGGCDACSMER